MTRVRLSMVCVFFFAVYVGLEIRERAPGSHGSSLTLSTTRPESTKRFVWDVTLDPQGRPYDIELSRGSRIARRPLTVLHAPSGRVLFMGGEYLAGPVTNEPGATLAERPGRHYPVHAIWELRTRKKLSGIVGVVIVERDTPIARWRILHDAAYVTDGGTGESPPTSGR